MITDRSRGRRHPREAAAPEPVNRRWNLRGRAGNRRSQRHERGVRVLCPALHAHVACLRCMCRWADRLTCSLIVMSERRAGQRTKGQTRCRSHREEPLPHGLAPFRQRHSQYRDDQLYCPSVPSSTRASLGFRGQRQPDPCPRGRRNEVIRRKRELAGLEPATSWLRLRRHVGGDDATGQVIGNRCPEGGESDRRVAGDALRTERRHPRRVPGHRRGRARPRPSKRRRTGYGDTAGSRHRRTVTSLSHGRADLGAAASHGRSGETPSTAATALREERVSPRPAASRPLRTTSNTLSSPVARALLRLA
jgi:hypothetical protein